LNNLPFKAQNANIFAPRQSNFLTHALTSTNLQLEHFNFNNVNVKYTKSNLNATPSFSTQLVFDDLELLNENNLNLLC